MSRLIDADALIECLQTWKNVAVSEGLPINERFAVAMIAQVNLMPTIEERKKGKWIHHDGGYSDHYECTACGRDTVLTEGKWRYCPNCGADMRGGQE